MLSRKLKSNLKCVSAGILIGYSCVHPLHAADPMFSHVQKDDFAIAGSLSNAWADYDNDGDLDFAVSIKGGEVRLYENNNGKFVNVGPKMGLPTSGDEIRGLSWGDFDGDGDVDLLGGSNVSPIPSRSYVYRNDNGAEFVEIAAEIGLEIPGRYSRQSNWIDYDNDGDLDLYAANRAGANRLYRNDDGKFSGLGYASGTVDSRRTVGVCWFDYDGDGDLDYFLANQSGDSDALMRNDGGQFVDVAPELGMDETLRPQSQGGVGCAVGDYDNDGDFDLYVAVYGPNLLYRNNGDGTFDEVGEALGVTDPDHTVGAAWGDYDNDGRLDLMVIGYHRMDGVQVPLNKLYQNSGDGFTDVTPLNPMINAGDHGVEWIDFDNDGDVDLSLTDGYGDEGGHFLFRNDLKRGKSTGVLAVLPLGKSRTFTKSGAEVRLLDQNDEVVAARIVSTGGGYNTQSATPVYFGLPSNDDVTVEVRFMGDNGGSVKRIENVSVKGEAWTLEVIEP